MDLKKKNKKKLNLRETRERDELIIDVFSILMFLEYIYFSLVLTERRATHTFVSVHDLHIINIKILLLRI